jgi:Carboxylesterase family
MRLQTLLLTFALAAASFAAPPPEIAAKLHEMGPVLDVAGVAKLYRPLQPTPPYPGVKVERNIKYVDTDRTVLDVFSPEKGGGKRPVLIYVSGGAGNKMEPVPDGDAFYDNIMLWAVKNGMTGVNVQRRGGQGLEWNETAKDIGRVIDWVQQNISKYKGNPDRLFIWAHSAGTGPVSTYVGHPELYGPKGVGLKGVVLMGTPAFNIAPVPAPARGGAGPGGPPKGGPPPDGKGGPPPDGKGGPDGKAFAKGKGGGRGFTPPDPAVQLARSNLPGLLKVNIPIFLGAGELDLPGVAEFHQVLKDQLCMVNHCPTVAIFKDHSHVSEVFSPNTADDSVTGPILKWMKSAKK